MCPSLEIQDKGMRRKPITRFDKARCPKCKRHRIYPYRENKFYKGESGLPEDPRQPFLLQCSICGYRVFQTKLDTPEEDFNRIFHPQ